MTKCPALGRGVSAQHALRARNNRDAAQEALERAREEHRHAQTTLQATQADHEVRAACTRQGRAAPLCRGAGSAAAARGRPLSEYREERTDKGWVPLAVVAKHDCLAHDCGHDNVFGCS